MTYPFQRKTAGDINPVALVVFVAILSIVSYLAFSESGRKDAERLAAILDQSPTPISLALASPSPTNYGGSITFRYGSTGGTGSSITITTGTGGGAP